MAGVSGINININITRSSMLCVFHQISFRWSSKRDGQDT
jgi:hypothetical protein